MTAAPSANHYIHPLTIGQGEHQVVLPNNLTLAPMAGFTNVAFRLIAKEVGGCGLVASEMVAAIGPHSRVNQRKFDLLTRSVPAEKPIAMQVYGREPELCGRTALDLQQSGADIVDLNCGCPVRKAKNSGCGVALMREPEQVGKIVKAMRAAVTVPVAVKMRLGYSDANRTMIEVAQAAIENGADMLAVHARTGESKHGEPVDLTGLKAVKDMSPIPVLANGSMDTAESIRRAKDEAGADGYQIGRAACGDPWLFRNLIAELSGEPMYEPGLRERRELLERHYQLICELFGEDRGTVVMRKYTFFYCQGLPGVRAFRDRFVRLKTAAEFLTLVEEFFTGLEEKYGVGATMREILGE
jgi:nifR3 family TIM-barrel protein